MSNNNNKGNNKMNKFEHKIKFDDVMYAVKLWACGIDGYDGAIGGIYAEIPWDEDIDAVLPWSEVEDKFSDVIPCCPRFDIKKIVMGDNCECCRLEKFANGITTDICVIYDSLINELNKKFEKRYSVDVRKCLGVDEKGVCKYGVIESFYGASKYEAITNMVENGYIGDWSNNVGCFYDSLYNGMVVHIDIDDGECIDCVLTDMKNK